jgi:hypothetical protein
MTKEQARHRLQYAVRKGWVIKPNTCTCGNPRVEAHHMDYDKPLDVIWRCSRCHKALHPETYAPTHCPNGHPYAAANLRIKIENDGYARRRCRACDREHSRKYWVKHEYSAIVRNRRQERKD